MTLRILRARPRCAVCDHEVEDFQSVEDDFLGRVVFYAICHGQRERVVLTRAELEAINGAITFGEAFRGSPALPGKDPAP